VEALRAAQPLIPVAALGSLRYGGNLHWLMAGSFYAGTGAAGYCVDEDGVPCTCRSPGALGAAEIYYADPGSYELMKSRAMRLGLRFSTITVELLGARLQAEALAADSCGSPSPARLDRREPLRLLVALPPHLEPPAAPMAVYTVELPGFEPCESLRCFQRGGGGEAAAVDVVAPLSRLEDWARSAGARLGAAVARIQPHGVAGLVLLPVVDEEQTRFIIENRPAPPGGEA